jgi:hypothetical protein
MITLTGQIDVLVGGVIDSVTTTYTQNNISAQTPPYNKKVSYESPFIIGASAIGSPDALVQSSEAWIGRVLSQKVGDDIVFSQFTSGIPTFAVKGSGITTITIEFDTKNNRYPHSITVDDEEFADNDPIYTISGLDGSKSSHIIKVNSWNVVNAPLVITGIYSGLSIAINKSNIASVNFGVRKKDGNGSPSFGIIASSSGSLTIKDASGEIYDLASAKLLGDDILCKFYLNETTSHKTMCIAKRIASGWKYDINSKTASCSLSDGLEKMQEIDIEIDYISKPTVYLLDVFNQAKNKATEFGFTISASEDALTVLQTTQSNNAHIKNGSLWSAFNKICQICAFYMYTDYDAAQGNNVVKIVCEGEVQ